MRDRYGILDGELARGLVRFGLPLSVGMALHALFNVVDMMIVGHLPEGARALGVLALCDLLAMLATVVATGISNAAGAVIARKVGEADGRRATETCWRSFTVLAAAAVAFAVVAVLLARPIVSVMGAQGWLKREAARYLQVIMGGSFTAFALVHATAAMRAAGHSYTPTILLFAANLLNLVLAVVFVYGPEGGPPAFGWGAGLAQALGIPRMGVVGAAWATVLARGVVAIPGILLVARDFRPSSWSDLKPTRADTGQLASIAWPSSAQYGVRVAGILVLLAIVGHVFTTRQDSSALSAMGVAIRLDTIGLFIAMGWGAAAATFVGQNLGAGQFRRATGSGWLAALLGGSVLLGLGLLFIVFSGTVVGFFTTDATVAEVVWLYLVIVGPSYGAFGVGAALSSALAGAGETQVSLRIDAATLFGFQTPILLLLVVLFRMPLVTCFVVVSAGNFVCAILYAYAFSKGRWQARTMK